MQSNRIKSNLLVFFSRLGINKLKIKVKLILVGLTFTIEFEFEKKFAFLKSRIRIYRKLLLFFDSTCPCSCRRHIPRPTRLLLFLKKLFSPSVIFVSIYPSVSEPPAPTILPWLRFLRLRLFSTNLRNANPTRGYTYVSIDVALPKKRWRSQSKHT